MLKIGMIFLSLILFTSCGNKNIDTKYLVQTIRPTMQPEEADLGQADNMLADCFGSLTGDLVGCERELLDWVCINAVKFKVFSYRATGGLSFAIVPDICVNQ